MRYALQKGFKSLNGQVEIVDMDSLCYLVLNRSKGASGLRTISKSLVDEYVSYFDAHPHKTAEDARKDLSGKTHVDKFEYGYTSTLMTLAKMVLGEQLSPADKSLVTSLEKTVELGDEALQQIFFGAPGTGKSHRINEVCAEYENYRTTFHPDTDYASFVGSYKPITEVVTKYDMHGHAYPEKRIVYTYVFQAFLKAYIAAWREQQKENPAPVFLVVEEINRGNCAQIFGDIFQLLDRNEAGYSDYPIVADDDLAQELRREFADLTVADAEGINALYRGGKDVVGSVKSGRQLLLPNNLYIWATMNTSDQSLFPIDSAFKRRWDWKYIKIKDSRKDYKIVFSNGNVYDWWSFVSEINRRIEGGEIQQEDKKLGYFFAKSRSGVITAERFLSKVIFYLYNDVFKDFGFDEDYFKGADGEPMTFASYFDEEGEADEAQIERFLKNLGLRPENITETDGAPSEETETEPGE